MNTRLLTDFELLIPETLAQALDVLHQYQTKVSVIAGGTDELVAIKMGSPREVMMSIAKLGELNYLSFDANSGLRIGAQTTIADLLASEVVKKHYPALWQSAEVFATPQLRNTATLLGNLLRASPAGDCSCAVYALGGTLLLQSTRGKREVDIDDFWLSYNVTAREPDELAIELKLPKPAASKRSAFQRLTRTYEDLAKISASACLDMSGKVCTSARLAMGCVAATPVRLKQAEKLLQGAEINAALLQQLAVTAVEEINPIDDIRSTAEYRRDVAGVLLNRVINLAFC